MQTISIFTSTVVSKTWEHHDPLETGRIYAIAGVDRLFDLGFPRVEVLSYDNNINSYLVCPIETRVSLKEIGLKVALFALSIFLESSLIIFIPLSAYLAKRCLRMHRSFEISERISSWGFSDHPSSAQAPSFSTNKQRSFPQEESGSRHSRQASNAFRPTEDTGPRIQSVEKSLVRLEQTMKNTQKVYQEIFQPNPQVAQERLQTARQLCSEGKLKEAELALQSVPYTFLIECDAVLCQIAQAYLARKELDPALQALEKISVKLSPNYHALLAEIAHIYVDLKQDEHALEILAFLQPISIPIAERHDACILRIAQSYRTQGLLEKALGLDQRIKAKKTRSEFQNEIGLAYFEKENYQEAFQTFLRFMPQQTVEDLALQAAQSLYEQKKHKEALECLTYAHHETRAPLLQAIREQAQQEGTTELLTPFINAILK